MGYTTETSTGRQIDIRRVPLLPGEDLQLSLFWQVEQSTQTDYTAFVHIVDSNGQMLTQHDSQPVRGLLPTSLWHKGQMVVDTYTLTIPAGAALGNTQFMLVCTIWPHPADCRFGRTVVSSAIVFRSPG
ncbi:MAG: hypothetical protein R2867_02165 [Caldilineaceae bacterium]